MLGDGVLHAAGEGTRGVKKDDGYGEDPEGGAVLVVGGGIGVVGCDDEDGVVVPRLLAGGVEEALEGVVGVADAFMDGEVTFGEAAAVFVRNVKRVVGGGCEESGDEGFREVVQGEGEELEEGLVPDGPGAVEVVVAVEAAVGSVFVAAEVMLESCGACESLESHGPILGTVVEG